MQHPNDLKAIFERIYASDSWTNGSGPGSAPSSTIEYRAFVERFMIENDVRTVTDLGCGDWQFSRMIDWSGKTYRGYDVAKTIIDLNNNRYANESIIFEVIEHIEDLPGGDLLIAKEVLQHLPNAMVAAMLPIIAARYKFALITNAIEPLAIANTDIAPGDWRPLRLEREPFNYAGATVLVYFPQQGSHFWRNGVFLMIGAVLL